MEKFPGKYDFARKFVMKWEELNIKVSMAKLQQYFIASNDAATALENLNMLEPVTANE